MVAASKCIDPPPALRYVMQDFVTVLSVLFVIIFSVFVDTYYKVIWHKHIPIMC